MRQVEKRIRLKVPTGRALTRLKRDSGRTTVGVRATIRAIADHEFDANTQSPDGDTVGIFESIRAICAWNG